MKRSSAKVKSMLKVYGMSSSGNCHKVKLLLTQLGTQFEWEEIDIMSGTTRTKQFLAMNPNGRVPLLELSPGSYLAESNAILAYLAEGTPFFPAARYAKALVLQWMFFEQYSHEPYIAVARFIRKFLPPDHPRHAELPRLEERGYQALAVMERQLTQHHFLVDEQYSIADIALMAYTHVADQWGFDLKTYPAIRAWLVRVAAQPHYFPMQD